MSHLTMADMASRPMAKKGWVKKGADRKGESGKPAARGSSAPTNIGDKKSRLYTHPRSK